MDRQELLERITELPDRSIRIIENVIRALDGMKENKYPFLGNFLNVIKEENDNPDAFVCSMPIVPEVLNPYRIVYGGVTATLADMTIAWMLEHRLEPGTKFVTIDMNVNYHKAGTGKRLYAEARLTNRARDVVQASCSIQNDKGDLVATSTATFLLLIKNG